LQRKEQESRARQQELQIELLRKQAEQQVQISQALMTMMQNLMNKYEEERTHTGCPLQNSLLIVILDSL